MALLRHSQHHGLIASKKGLHGAIKAAVDLILPPQCLLSGEIVGVTGQIDARFWKDIHFIDGAQCETCGRPFPFDPGPDMACTSCLARPPAYNKARAPVVYDAGSRGLVLALKHGDRTEGVGSFALWMIRAGGQLVVRSQVIVPVPLHHTRLMSRRYNQSALLATAIGRETGLPVVNDFLIRTRRTESQKGKDTKQRKKNVRDAFDVRARWRGALKGAHILLIDDVLTTGATADACAVALRNGGAENVNVLTLTRVVGSIHAPI